jgi:hypothetical protein
MAQLCCLVGMCLGGGTTVALFCIREPWADMATCDTCASLSSELGG